VLRPRQVVAAFTEYLVAFVAEQPLKRRIHVLQHTTTRIHTSRPITDRIIRSKVT